MRLRPETGGWSLRWGLEAVLLTLLVLAIYLPRLTELSLRGEESRRAQVAREMLWTGDWVVPRQQGEPFLSRPPLGSWVIVLAAYVRGDCDPLAVRLPSVLATLLTALLVYGYSRTFLPRLGSLAAGAAYATMAQVLELGRLGETEAVFTLLVSSSLLVWHWGYQRAWPAGWTWGAGYTLAALGTLAKGPQAPVYFGGAVGSYLLLMGRWRALLTRAHLAGLILFAVVVGAWQVPFYREMGWAGVRQIWASDTALHLTELRPGIWLHHLATYPFEILCCTAPWSLVLFFYGSRRLRHLVGEARPQVTFLVTCLAVTFPTCWLAPGAQSRYFMPLFPCLAPLLGLVPARCSGLRIGSSLRSAWDGSLALVAVLLAALGGVVLAASYLAWPRIAPLSQPQAFALTYGLAALGAGAAAWRLRRRAAARWESVGVLSLAGFLGLTNTGLVTNAFARKSENAALAVVRLKERYPECRHLVSFGPVHHLFAYYFAEPIALRPLPRTAADLEDKWQYFCFDRLGKVPVNLPFPWEEVAAVSCDRYRAPLAQWEVVVGRRLFGSQPPQGWTGVAEAKRRAQSRPEGARQ